jgi:protein-tyrosine phosphatase
VVDGRVGWLKRDLHCHILPGIDDGAASFAVSLGMARASVADVVSIVCTPHILPGLYPNAGPQIVSAVQHLQNTFGRQFRFA